MTAAMRAAALALEQLAARLDSNTNIRQVGSGDPRDDWETLQEENRQLREALDSRATIERAKGMLMALRGCSEQEAFKILATAARRQHRKVRLVAEDLLVGQWAADMAAPIG
jgi:hypothetical protein